MNRVDLFGDGDPSKGEGDITTEAEGEVNNTLPGSHASSKFGDFFERMDSHIYSFWFGGILIFFRLKKGNSIAF